MDLPLYRVVVLAIDFSKYLTISSKSVESEENALSVYNKPQRELNTQCVRNPSLDLVILGSIVRNMFYAWDFRSKVPLCETIGQNQPLKERPNKGADHLHTRYQSGGRCPCLQDGKTCELYCGSVLMVTECRPHCDH